MRDAIHILQTATRNLHLEIEWIKAVDDGNAYQAGSHLKQAKTQLASCGDLLNEVKNSSDADEQRIIADYRDCLKRLQEALAVLQSRLLAKRSLLAPEQEHIKAATAWTSCAKNILG